MISECRQRKFSQPVIQSERGRKSCPETSSVNSHLVRAKGGFKRSYVLKTKEEGYI